MTSIFLSASVPQVGRGTFHESADPFLIQLAVRELVTVCLGRRRIIWGGHPSITPMVWAVCEDFGMKVELPVQLYQSEWFRERFPDENRFFPTTFTTKGETLDASLQILRNTMLSQPLDAAVFIGGMEGIFQEFEMFRHFHPTGLALAVDAPGGAARDLPGEAEDRDRIDFARLFYQRLGISPNAPRELIE
jgi:hypothetical protein